MSTPLLADTPDGDYDTSWGNGGTISFAGDQTFFRSISVDQIVVEPNGRLLVAGQTQVSGGSYGWYLGERLFNGSASPTFGESDGSGLVDNCYLSSGLCGGLPTPFYAFALQADSSIAVLGGSMLSRLISGGHGLATGSVSGGTGYVTLSGFQINDVKGVFQFESALLPLASGKWLVGGAGYYSQATSTNIDFAVIRLNSDFTLDTTFNAHTDGSGVTFAGGQLVPFDLAGGDDSEIVQQMQLQSDGRIVLIGVAHSSNGSLLAIARLNADGTLDSTFGAGTGKVVPNLPGYTLRNLGYPHAALNDAADRLLVAVEVDVGSTAGTGVLRLLPSGAPDTNFDGSGLSYTIAPVCTGSAGRYTDASALALDSAGRIIVVGSCWFADGSTQFLVERLFGDDGNIDATFANFGFGPGVFVANSDSFGHDIVIDASGRPVIGGYAYLTQTGVDNAGLARLTYDLIFTNSYERVPRGRLPGQ